MQIFVKISEDDFTKALERHAEDKELMNQIQEEQIVIPDKIDRGEHLIDPRQR